MVLGCFSWTEESEISTPAALPSRPASPLSAVHGVQDRSVESCRICGTDAWSLLYEGPIRQGRFGNLTAEPRRVLRCAGCGVGQLEAASEIDYGSTEYRELVDGDGSAERYHALHDNEQADKLRLLGTAALRGKIVADVGCGGGSFLDLIKGIAATTIGIEPTRSYRDALASQGHAVFPFCADAADQWHGRVDVAVCFSVIEHVADPVSFLQEIRRLLRPGSTLLISTPNLRDWLLELLPKDYAAFFYRTVHSWYFDAASLAALSRAAGFTACEVRSVHRFDLSNVLVWLRDRRPSGLGAVSVSAVVNAAFAGWLESEGRADYLYATLSA
jgi:2-polyprenyl-3-methyl-5-hydroxy-6-metoxy-1,4-benzoquinol methylase